MRMDEMLYHELACIKAQCSAKIEDEMTLACSEICVKDQTMNMMNAHSE